VNNLARSFWLGSNGPESRLPCLTEVNSWNHSIRSQCWKVLNDNHSCHTLCSQPSWGAGRWSRIIFMRLRWPLQNIWGSGFKSFAGMVYLHGMIQFKIAQVKTTLMFKIRVWKPYTAQTIFQSLVVRIFLEEKTYHFYNTVKQPSSSLICGSFSRWKEFGRVLSYGSQEWLPNPPITATVYNSVVDP
jgi:hypothetical protein